ncbi:unnamed protein product, partial [Owenia fusiformis]
ALVMLIACIVFGVGANDRAWMPRPDQNYFSWSFGFYIISMFFSVFAGPPILMHAMQVRRDAPKERPELYAMEQFGYSQTGSMPSVAGTAMSKVSKASTPYPMGPNMNRY